MRAKTKPEPRPKPVSHGADIDDPSWEIVDTWEHLETRPERIMRLMSQHPGEWMSTAAFIRMTGMGIKRAELDALVEEGRLESRDTAGIGHGGRPYPRREFRFPWRDQSVGPPLYSLILVMVMTASGGRYMSSGAFSYEEFSPPLCSDSL